MKSAMTSFDVAASIYELTQVIENSRIENIYQIDHQTLVLRLHRSGQPTLQLLIEAGKRVHLTSYSLTKPPVPPAFCMTLRKYLKNGRVQNIEQLEFERIIRLKIETREGSYALVAELFGEGNIILVDSQNVIIVAKTYKEMRDRNILRNEAFKNAPASGKNPFSTTREQMNELADFGDLEIVRSLTKFFSIGGPYAEETLVRAGVDKNTPSRALSRQQLNSIYDALMTLSTYLRERKFDPAIVLDSAGEMLDVTPIRLKRYEEMDHKPYKTFNEALDEYYTRASLKGRVSDAEKDYERELAKLQRVLQDQQRILEDSKRAIEQCKSIGDLIYAHFGQLQQLLQLILEQKQAGKTWEQIIDQLIGLKKTNQIPAVYFDSLTPKNMIANVTIENHSFPINVSSSIQANAADYYQRMKKAQKKAKGAKKALLETQSKIQKLQKVWAEREEEIQSEAPGKQAKKVWFEKFRWFRSIDDFLVVGGRDAITNEILIKKHLEPGDIVFHADVVGAPFAVVKSEGKAFSDQIIQEAAQFAASFSRAWREMFSAVDVYWIYPDQLSKSPPSGQYLDKGAFVIRGAKNYVRRVPLRVGIGLKMQDERLQIISGPAETISRVADVSVEIVPGRTEGKELLKQIRSQLIRKAPKAWIERIRGIRDDQLQGFVPFGRGEITLK